MPKLDLLGAAAVGCAAVAGASVQRLIPSRAVPGPPKLLTLEATYSLDTIRERRLEHEITCRDVNGFFDHVWSVHPAVGASPEHSRASSYGPPSSTRIADRHTMVEGRVGRFEGLDAFPRLNFALAQADLAAKLRRLARRENVAIVRAGDPYYLALLGMVVARAQRLPLVVRVNGNYDHVYAATGALAYPRLLRSRAIEKRIERFVFDKADLVAPGSVDNLNFVLRSGGRRENSTIFGYGTWIDPVHFDQEPEDRASVRDELGLGDRPFAIMVSRLEPLKHPDDALLAVGRAKAHAPELAVVFVGDGSMRAEMEATATELGITDDVHFIGNRSQGWIADALTSATVVLSPLTGRALVEACLSGTPVVAYDIEWHSELITSGETGILVPFRDIAAMADAICDLVADPALADTLGQKARAATRESMDPGRLMAHERSEYLKLLSRNDRARRPGPVRRTPGNRAGGA